jgi:8-oxo-dGTP pyrophosphatase MutT (NUDIX family)
MYKKGKRHKNKNKIKLREGAGILCYRYNYVIRKYEFLLVCKTYSNDFMKILTGRYKINKGSLDLNRLSRYEIYMIRTIPNGDIYIRYFNIDLNSETEEGKKRIIEFIKKINDRFDLYKRYIYYSDSLNKTYSSALTNSIYFGDVIIQNMVNPEEPKKITDYFNEIYLASLKYNVENIKWEIPKGHINKNESIFNCAIRELSEETNIDPVSLNIHKRYKKIERIKFANYIYKVIYFLAKYKDIYSTENIDNFVMSIDRKNCNEILCCKWFTYEEIKYITMDPTKRKFINSYYKYIKKLN